MHCFYFQILRRVTDGGADYSFECIGDTEMITTAMQSSCDVNDNYFFYNCTWALFIYFLIIIIFIFLWGLFSKGMGFDSYTWSSKGKA